MDTVEEKVSVEKIDENGDTSSSSENENCAEAVLKEKDEMISKKDAEITQLKELLLRSRADFDNFRKRCIKNEDMNKKLAVKDFALDIITINDNLIRASEVALHIDEGDTLEHAHKSYVEGVMMISKSIEQSLGKNGVEEIDSFNCPFNPVFHEAIEFDTSEGIDSDMVSKVYQKGFKIDAMVIRTAKVKVSKPAKKQNSTEQNEESRSSVTN
jgi:molecular chaperone GrpE